MGRSVRILPRLTRYEDTRSEFSEASGMESDNFPPSLPPSVPERFLRIPARGVVQEVF